MRKALLIILLIFGTTRIFSAETGVFSVVINDGSKNITLYMYVPDNYNPDNEYTLIAAMPLGGNSGRDIRARLMPAAMEIGAILVCPDYMMFDVPLMASGVDYAMETYNIDSDAVILSGYSYGGGIAFDYAAENYESVTGYIGIAPAIVEPELSPEIVSGLPLGLIVGDLDGMKEYCDDLIKYYSDNGGNFHYIVKEDVDHMGEYFSSDEFTDDWLECYYEITGHSTVHEGDSPCSLTAYPNPASDMIHISWNNNEASRLSIVSLSGQKAGDYLTEGQSALSVPCSALTPGIYYVIIKKIDGSEENIKVLIAR